MLVSRAARWAAGGYGVSTRTIVGFGIPTGPLYATEPRYLVPVVRPLKVRLIAPVVPMVAAAGAVTVMFPAAVLPSNQVWSLNGLDPATPQPWTTTV